MFTQSMLPRLARASHRAYSTAPAAAKSNQAPLFLGAGLVGAGVLYYSTRQGAPKVDTRVSALNPDEFQSFKLAKVTKYNHNTSLYAFDIPEGTHASLPTASALVVKAVDDTKALNDKGKPKITPYTPVNLNGDNQLELLIKHYPNGIMTEHIHSLKPGDSLAVKGPIPKWQYKANEFDEVALIAGGSGITPMWQLLHAIDINPADKTKATLLFANVTEEDILLRKQFDELAARKPDQFKIHYILDKPPAEWKGFKGYITKEVVTEVLGDKKGLGDKIKVFVCGPPPQMKAISGPKKSFKDQGEVQGVLKELGYEASQVYKF